MLDTIGSSKRRSIIRRALIALALAALSLMTAGLAQAAPGALLKAVTTPWNYNEGGVAVDRHGRTVMAGWKPTQFGDQIVVVRYRTNDELDFSFGASGIALLNPGPAILVVSGIAIDSHDRIVVAATARNSDNYDFFVGRFDDDGHLDTSFNDGKGWMTVDSGDEDRAFAMMLDGDDNILLAGAIFQTGFLSLEGDFHLAMARVRPDGHLDNTFGDHVTGPFGIPSEVRTGTVVTGFDDGQWGQALTFDLQGRIIVVGVQFHDDDTARIVMARYTFDGQLDSSFGDGGRVTSSFNARFSWPHSVVVDQNGILVGGLATPGVPRFFENTSPLNNGNLALARYNDDGSRDLTFGAGGVVQNGYRRLR
jgi:uncharacterized delta-60 repeat protein